MGAYDFGSWTLHMAFIIVFSNLWAIRLGEWRGTRPRTLRMIVAGIAIVFLSTLLVGLSNYLASDHAPHGHSTNHLMSSTVDAADAR